MPQRTMPSVLTPCASESTRMFTPASRAARAWTSERSRRSGAELISSIVAARAGGLRHLLDAVAPVRGGGVAVQVAHEVLDGDEVGERAARSGLQLAAALAQLGRDPGHAEPGVDLLLGRAARRLTRGVVE